MCEAHNAQNSAARVAVSTDHDPLTKINSTQNDRGNNPSSAVVRSYMERYGRLATTRTTRASIH